MIIEIDDGLRDLIRAEVLGGSTDVEISFEKPDDEWSARRNAPTFNLYLYDVSENTNRREVALEPVRDPDGRITERRPPPRRFDLAYMVSAWTQRVEDEHRLLDDLLVCLLTYEHLPKDYLSEELADSSIPVRLTTGRPRPDNRKATDIWNGIGGSLRPTIDLLVTAPMTSRAHKVAGPPVIEAPRFSFAGEDGEAETRRARERPRRGGRLTPAASREPVAEEVVQGGPPDADGEGVGRKVVVKNLPR